MNNLFGEPYEYVPAKPRDKDKLNWENRFQRWSDNIAQDGCTPLGKCGYGEVCDWCKDNDYGRPCVRALNTMMREKRLTIDYKNADYEKVWSGTYWDKQGREIL